jgi:hypothetical protein
VSQAERAATWLSLACAVHCLVLPLAMSVMPMLGASGIAFDHRTELALTVLVVASALLGGVWGYRRHRDARIVLASVSGLVAYLVGHLLEGSWVGVALAVCGGLMLAASSFIGARLAHHCEDAGCAHST